MGVAAAVIAKAWHGGKRDRGATLRPRSKRELGPVSRLDRARPRERALRCQGARTL